MRQSGLKPPRTSAGQFLWVRDAGNLTPMDPKASKLDDPIFKKLTPGDLVFWSGTYVPADGRKVKISHVGMYLGTEKKDGRPVMINATTGRSYRGTAADGFGVYDFKLPSSKSKSRFVFVGYGSPPGLK
ncbi:C40 family peptidase [Akkermansiaceae bacterium]|nr:C40 family peptidase [Akkermansiaceae bacterium]